MWYGIYGAVAAAVWLLVFNGPEWALGLPVVGVAFGVIVGREYTYALPRDEPLPHGEELRNSMLEQEFLELGDMGDGAPFPTFAWESRPGRFASGQGWLVMSGPLLD